MTCTISSNNIPVPEVRDAIAHAVCSGIGDRPGQWSAVIYHVPDYPALAIRIEGPEEIRWSWTFREHEQVPEFIQHKIAAGINEQLALRNRGQDT